MGLRIIDRRPRGPEAAASAELAQKARTGLEQEAARSYASIEGGERAEDQFLAKLRAAQARVLPPAEMMGRAEEVRAVIRLMNRSPEPVHAKIDIATLVELL